MVAALFSVGDDVVGQLALQRRAHPAARAGLVPQTVVKPNRTCESSWVITDSIAVLSVVPGGVGHVGADGVAGGPEAVEHAAGAIDEQVDGRDLRHEFEVGRLAGGVGARVADRRPAGAGGAACRVYAAGSGAAASRRRATRSGAAAAADDSAGAGGAAGRGRASGAGLRRPSLTSRRSRWSYRSRSIRRCHRWWSCRFFRRSRPGPRAARGRNKRRSNGALSLWGMRRGGNPREPPKAKGGDAPARICRNGAEHTFRFWGGRATAPLTHYSRRVP